MAPAFVPSTARRGSCQRFARNCAPHNLTSPTTQPSAAPFTCSVAWVDEVVHGDVNYPHINGSKGSGVKSPQLHQAQRIGRTPDQGHLSADCQQITPCGRNNALSAARFRRLQAIRGGIRREQGEPGHGRGPAPAAELDRTGLERPVGGRGRGRGARAKPAVGDGGRDQDDEEPEPVASSTDATGGTRSSQRSFYVCQAAGRGPVARSYLAGGGWRSSSRNSWRAVARVRHRRISRRPLPSAVRRVT